VADTVRQVVGQTVRVDWRLFEGAGALRCTAGVAIPLLAGLALGQPSVAAFGAVGAVSVGFGSFQGAYRSRAAVMVSASLAMGIAMAAGSMAGRSDAAAILVSTAAAFVGGLVGALGASAAFVGLQAIVAVLIATGFPSGPREAAIRGAIVIGGGLAQTLLVALLWPLRRFTAERTTIAEIYRSLSAYAVSLADPRTDAAPEPHTFAVSAAPLDDPQPFAHAGEVLVFQALFDEADRIRSSLAALVARRRDAGGDPGCTSRFFTACAAALDAIAAALDAGREPHDTAGIWDDIDACAPAFERRVLVEALLGQVRAAWRTAGVLGDDRPSRTTGQRLPPLRRRPPVRDALTTLAANLTPQSTACRHALRTAIAVLLGTAAYRLWHMPRGYWMPMTAVLVLKPEFHDTFSRGIARIAGTVAGAFLAGLIVRAWAPGHVALMALVLISVWGCYAFFRMNYAIFAVCLTGYVVFILMLSGVGPATAAMLREEYTLGGGALALLLYALFPTWAGTTARAALASMLRLHSQYVDALLTGFADPSRIDLQRIGGIRSEARLARSNAEAVIERMIAEPARRAGLPPRVAVGILAALRRHALAALALHAGLERGVTEGVPGMARLAPEMSGALTALATALDAGTPPPPLPDLRTSQLALGKSDALVNDETDLMVDSVNTIASLLARPRYAEGPP
jgi:hypothetical protein